MARKSKGAIEREKKLTRKESFSAFMESDPRFQQLNMPQKMAIAQWRIDFVKEGERLAEIDGYELGIIETLACVIEVLVEDYWKKSADKRIPKLVRDVDSLLDSKLHGHVTFEEMLEYIEEHAKLSLNRRVIQKDGIPSPAVLFNVSK